MREAHYLASEEQAADLERVRLMVEAKALCVFEAQGLIRDVIRELERKAA